MPFKLLFRPGREKVILQFDDDLDLTLSRDIFAFCNLPWSGMASCVLDMRKVGRVFDSGIALTIMLMRRLRDAGIEVELRHAPVIVQRWLDAARNRQAQALG